jgi:Tol biopolymer transport system component
MPTSGAGGSGAQGGTSGGATPGALTDPGTGITVDASMPPCPRCGTPNEPTRAFCKYCGEQLTAVAPVSTAAPKGRGIDTRVAVGGAIVILAIGATAVFAFALAGAKPAPTLPPASIIAGLPTPSASPSASIGPSASASGLTSPSASTSASATASATASPSSSAGAASASPTASPSAPLPTAPTTIAFYAVRTGKADIFTIPPAGGKLTNLTNDLAADSDPKWSPDGQRLAFDSRHFDNERNIVVLELDGTLNELTHDTGATNAFPTWSPDGQEIAWSHNGEIWVMNSVDGSQAHPLTTGANDSRPSWSTDGQIAFFRTTPGNHEIWTVPADSSAGAQALISVADGGGRQPSWSPDGTKLAYAKLENNVLRIAVANPDGSGQKTITPGAPCPCQFPTWSPDGRKIAFQAGPAGKEQIYVIAATGGAAKRVTDGQGQNLAPGWGS